MLGEVEGYTVLAGVNGDHFSFFQTGNPYGFCMDDGEILESPTDSKDAAAICFIRLASPDGEVVTGYNPTLIATYQREGSPIEDRISIERINRTREGFAASVLFTEAYGDSTKTEGGLELVIQVESGKCWSSGQSACGQRLSRSMKTATAPSAKARWFFPGRCRYDRSEELSGGR